jgi:hypothetical protein
MCGKQVLEIDRRSHLRHHGVMAIDGYSGVPEETPVRGHSRQLAVEMVEYFPAVQQYCQMISSGRIYGAANDITCLPVTRVTMQDLEPFVQGKCRVKIDPVVPPVGGAGIVCQLNLVVLAIEVADQCIAVAIR